jgi:hypothetical protein
MVLVEQKMLLQKKWRVAKTVMARAHRALPPPTLEDREQFEGSISRFHEYIDHDELGLAFEELCAAAELVNCRGGVWRDLERAAEVMGLHDRVQYVREKFRAAPIGGRWASWCFAPAHGRINVSAHFDASLCLLP